MIDIPVTSLKGIGAVKAGILKAEAAIETVEDLLYYKPRRYIDRSNLKRIIDTFHEEEVTVTGTVTSSKVIRAGKSFLQVDISDGTDTLSGIFFGGLQFFERIFIIGEHVVFSGKISVARRKQIVHPEFDFFDDESGGTLLNTGRIIPLYSSTMNLKKHGFDSRGFRRVIKRALDDYCNKLIEFLPCDILQRYSLPDIITAIQGIHFPDSFEHAENSRRRLAFNEVFSLHCFLLQNRMELNNSSNKKNFSPDEKLFTGFTGRLPFAMTDDQIRAVKEIKEDIFTAAPMNRLLQGDVGSGKTAVALCTSMYHIAAGKQVALLAPTEILARQHFDYLCRYIPDGVQCALLTGSMSKKEKETLYSALSDGSVSFVVGTHALLEAGVSFKNLGYIIIDEQHRFGVEQRGRLRTKGEATDLLVMTATPIPRSLSMTMYGDMDVSYIRQKPSDRPPVRTLSFTEERLPGVYRSIKNYLDQGRQVYYVLPLIEETDKSDLKSATETFEHLGKEIFPDKEVALIHSRIHQKEKDQIMERFRAGVIDILVSTTVIEVGIDVANASIMVIEHAERFGLSQLHQLRGRVGRGAHQSFCILIHKEDLSPDASERISVMTETDDGFIISEKDLLLRGSGQLVGTRQHGATDFEFTDLLRDYDIIISARSEAEKILRNQKDDFAESGSGTSGVRSELFNSLRTKRVLQILS